MIKSKKILLAFSGGLDTSYCVAYLKKELCYEVHTATVDTGGIDKIQAKHIEKLAKQLGAKTHRLLDMKERFFDEYIKFLIYGNVLRNQTYPLSVSAERVVQAIAIADYAKKIKADAIAHGSTGAGNDQIRFDVAFSILCPHMQIITPIRSQHLSRQEEVAFLQQQGIMLAWEKAQYSINKGMWGTSIGGKETLSSHQPLPEEAYPSHCTAEKPRDITISFHKGIPVAFNQKKYSPVALIEKLNAIGSAYAIGRDIHVGDTIIGIKGRVGFEAPAAMLLIKSHLLLEKHTQTKWQMYWKEQIGNFYGMLLHESQYFDPVMKDIEAFLTRSQERVTGDVYIRLHPYRFELLGVKTPHDLLLSKRGQYGESSKSWTSDDAVGFINIFSNHLKIFSEKQ